MNRHTSKDIAAAVSIAGAGEIARAVTVHELNGKEPLARNTFADQTQTTLTVEERDIEVRDGAFQYRFPAHSVTVLELRSA